MNTPLTTGNAKELCETLSARWRECPEQRAYVLINGVPRPDLYRGLLECFPRPAHIPDEWVSVVMDARDEHGVNQYGAFLVRLPGEEDRLDLLPKLMHICVQQPFAISFIFSPLGISELTYALQMRLNAMDEDYIEWQVKFFDTRCLAVLDKTLTQDQHQSFFSVVSEWWWLDREEHEQKIYGSGQSEDAFESPLKLNDAQQGAFTDASLIDSLLYVLAQHDEDLLVAFDQRMLYRIVADAIACAPKNHLDSTPLLVDWARRALINAT